jgi:Holliday junction resolvase
MSKDEIDAPARLLAEAINELGLGQDSRSIIEKVKQLQRGLPAEDEFMLLLSWLGKCRVVHKLDQVQVPPSSKDELRIPDLLAIFDFNNRLVPVLIEVKVSKGRKLSWRREYLESLRKYADLIKIPLLVAWKWFEFDLWTLCDSSVFERPHKNYKLSREGASNNSLMGKLAGDFSYVFQSGVGVHFKLRKVKRLDSKDTAEEHWQLEIMEAYYTDGKGNHLNTLGPGIWWLFIGANQEIETDENENHFLHRFIISEESPMYVAHRLLPIMTMGLQISRPISWRTLLKEHSFKIGGKDLLEEVRAAIQKNIIRYVFHQEPGAIPSFLKD